VILPRRTRAVPTNRRRGVIMLLHTSRWRSRVLLAALTTWSLLAASIPTLGAQGKQAPESQPAKSQLKRLIEGARREGRLNISMVSSQGAKGGKALTDAFKRRFGLHNMTITVDLSRGSAGDAHKAIAEHEAGIMPSFDVRYFVDEAVLLLKEARAIKRIEHWETLLREINPKAYEARNKLSPPPFDGFGFTFATRTDALLYNPKRIAEKDLPKTRLEYGLPRYKGMYSLPPWITTAMFGVLKYDKDEWLETVRSWGRNKGHMLAFAAGIERLLLGELSFLYANAYYYFEQKALDPNAPIGLSFFRDLTNLHRAMNVVLEGTRHANAAQLFALWSMSEEASLLFQEYASHPNIYLGTGSISSGELAELKKRRIDHVTWFDSPNTLSSFLWYETAEGKSYAQALDRAQREGK
jgi:iron(III) transport system substrate-binding protein